MEGVLGDIVICPWVAAQQAAAAGHSTMQEMLLLTIHGILHLLGYDHVTPKQERQMFGLQRQLLLTFFALRGDANIQATLPSGTPDALALYDIKQGTLAEALHLTQATLSTKLNRRVEWTVADIANAAVFFKEPVENLVSDSAIEAISGGSEYQVPPKSVLVFFL